MVDGKGLFKDGGTGLWSYDRDPSPLSLNLFGVLGGNENNYFFTSGICIFEKSIPPRRKGCGEDRCGLNPGERLFPYLALKTGDRSLGDKAIILKC